MKLNHRQLVTAARDSGTDRANGGWLRRFVRLLVNLKLMLSPCGGNLCFQNGTGAGEPLAASGLGESANNPRPTIVTCRYRQDRCKRCAWLHALGKLTARDAGKSQKYAFVNRVESDHRNGDWHATQIGDINSKTNLLSGVGVNSGDGDNLHAQPVVRDSSPSVDDAKHGTENTKNQTCDSGYERQMFHSAKQPNI